jgi:alkylation response protein AidB-like acyl-CoA dehydrogenase
LTRDTLITRMRKVVEHPIPLPGGGSTAERHQRLFEIGREDLSLARLVEAHWDALAILAEVGRKAELGVLYGVWAAEAADKAMKMDGLSISGGKPFCSGAGIVDRALVTVKEPEARLVDVDLRGRDGAIDFDESSWKTSAFAATKTSFATFHSVALRKEDIIGPCGYYLQRVGFWHGACGPAACWAGGAAGLFDWASKQKRNDPHTLAHLGAISAAIWSMEAALQTSGREIDAKWNDVEAAQTRALTVRHIVEQGCTDVIHRLARAHGPHPLTMDARIARRLLELEIYIRQSHAERDLESLGRRVLIRN